MAVDIALSPPKCYTGIWEQRKERRKERKEKTAVWGKGKGV